MKTLFKGLLKFLRFILFTVLNMFWWVIKFAFSGATRPSVGWNTSEDLPRFSMKKSTSDPVRYGRDGFRKF